MTNSYFKHPELDGSSFFLQGTTPPEQAPSVLLIHGFTATTSEVRPLGEMLNRKGLTVSAPLLAGHGTHPDDLNRTTWQDWYASAEEAYLALRGASESVWVGGESMGGVLALMLAANHPEIAGLLLFAPALKARLVWAAPIIKHFTSYVKKGDGGPDMAWSGYNVYPTRAMEQLLKVQRQGRTILTQVSQPTLVVMSKQDLSVPISVSALLHKELASHDVKYVILEDSPHVILLANRQMEAEEAAWQFLCAHIALK